jgi:predicted Zn-dependent peptidase
MGLVITLVLSAFAFSAHALPKVDVETINGYEVHFVDVGVGNTLGVIAYVPVGTMHEAKEKLGRAHFLEHLLHTGTKRFPGYHAFDEMLVPVGIYSNAYTSYDHTFYFAAGEASKAETTLKVFFSMFGGLEWNRETFRKEKGVVIEEIVDQGMQNDSRSLQWMSLVHLLPPSHPWAHPLLGDRPSLEGLSIEDLKELYYQNYNPQFVRFAVIGNFSDPAALAQIKQLAKANLQAPRWQDDPDRYKPKSKVLAQTHVPSFFSSARSPEESQRRIYLASNILRLNTMVFEGDLALNKISLPALHLLVSYLNDQAPGSLLHTLYTQYGWITDAGFQLMVFKNKVHLMFYAELTDQGLQHRHEVNQAMYTALRDVQLNAVDSEHLELMKSAGIQALSQSALSVSALMKPYGSVLADSKSFEQRVDELRAVTPQQLAQAALLFKADLALYTEMGPEKPEMVMDNKFNRGYVIEDNRAQLAAYAQILEQPPQKLFRPQLQRVDLPQVDDKVATKVFAQTKPIPHLVDRFTLDLRNDLPDSAVSVAFELGPVDADHLVALDLVMAAFQQRFSGELAYLNLKYSLGVGLSRRGRVFTVTANGPNRLSAQAVNWTLTKLNEFEPSKDELERAKNQYMQNLEGDYASAFTAQIGTSMAIHRVNPYSLPGLKARDIAAKLPTSEIFAKWKRWTKYSNQNLTMVGALTGEEFDQVRLVARLFSPRPLPLLSGKQAWASLRLPTDTSYDYVPFPEPKGKDSYALSRIYGGPAASELRDYIAFKALNEVLSMKVSNYNRGEQSLGYTHSTALVDLGGVSSIFLMYGQTEGAANAWRTVDGWDHVLGSMNSGEISESDLEAGIESLKNSMKQTPSTAAGWASAYSGFQATYRNARAAKDIISTLDQLTAEDLKDVAVAYLLRPDAPNENLIVGDCEGLLQPPQ